ncbi:MFS transporter [Kitasatospora viridis]|uniref:Sugar phosphate permease n=1 Tax=Kitasatospora viridis TaxID=281105 RepID=A0A561SGB4_9ACTN|nr:MFS transporter [Kitasatospora viridis]TWF73873.1 sugar phosphate permease [Kitasatospora viridis]
MLTLRPAPLTRLLIANGVSLLGTRVAAIALPWFVLATTGSAARTGVVAAFELLPYVLAKAFSGPLVDRVGARRVAVTADLLSALAAVGAPVLHALGLLSFPLLLLFGVLLGSARGPGDLAKYVLIPELAERTGQRLERASGIVSVAERLAQGTLGPAVGGLLVTACGPLAAMLVNGASFAVVAAMVGLGLPRDAGRPVVTAPAAESGEPGYWRQFGEGLAFLRDDRLLLALTAMITVTNLLDAAFTAVLLPVWAQRTGQGAGVVGLLFAVSGAAGVGGSLIAAAVAHRLPRRLVFFLAFLVAGAPRFVALALHLPLPGLIGVFVASGFAAGFINPILGAIDFERIPRRMLGRVGAIGDALGWAGIPLGTVLAGLAVGAAGVAPVLLVAGGLYFLTTNLTGFRHEWREMDRRRPAAAPKPAVAPDTVPSEV